MSARPLAEKRCHTCRRRRVVCDRLTPKCQKCEKAGVECLGYGKLVLWNKGIASRGKMMGKSFQHHDEPSVRSDSPQVSSNTFVALRPPPVDPAYQDLNEKSRFYLRHFADHVCRDFVQRDIPGRNSARTLVQLSKDHPALLHVAIASSANHLFNLSCISDTTWTKEVPWPSCSIDRAPPDVLARANVYLEDALAAEEKGYRFLIKALQEGSPDMNAILAVILLFVTCELIQSGKDRWRAHIDAAIRILKQIDASDLSRAQPKSSKASDESSLQEWLASELVVYIVLASTLGSTAIGPELPQSYNWLDPLLLRAEENNYLSCPATLLRVLLVASKLAHEQPLAEATKTTSDLTSNTPPSSATALVPSPANEAGALLQIVNAFDPTAWAVDVERRTSYSDFESRMHVASAHKIAVRLYVTRACPAASSSAAYLQEATRQSRSSLASAIIKHIAHIQPDDPLYKATPWPTFIAGAESDDEEEWAWVLQRLETAWTIVPWGYVRSEIEVLRQIWEQKRRWNGPDFDWIQRVRLMGVDVLII